jgi:DNA-binding transcriptional ArsR family regulator
VSIEAMNYVTTLQIGNPTRKYVLTRLADRADERFSCNPSVALLAAEVEIQPRAVQKHLAALREAGLLSDRVARRSDGSQTTNRYYLHGPWDDFGGSGAPFPTITTPRQARAELWAKPAAEGEFRPGTRVAEVVGEGGTAGQEGVSSRTSPPVSPATREGASSRTPLEPTVETTTTEPAPSGREAPLDVRRTTTGSRAVGAAGGSAASGKTKPRMLSKDERLAVEEVWRLLPADLVAQVPRNARGLEDAILDALAAGRPEERTADQLVTHRVMPRWNLHWATEFYAGRLDAPVGALRAMLERNPLCNDARCDEHVEVDTGQPCRACERTREDRRTDRRPQQSPPRLPAAATSSGETFTPVRYQPEQPARVAPPAEGEVEAVSADEALRQARAVLREGRGGRRRGRDHRPWLPAA